LGTLAACQSEDHLVVGSVERDLVAMAEEASAVEVMASCPENVSSDVGTRFRCTITTHGRSYPVRAEVTEATAEQQPWEFDEDDLHVGPATLTCAQLEEDSSWAGAAEQLLGREAVPTPAEARARQIRAVRELFVEECRAAGPTAVPYPQVAARFAGS
jgi:hypothetical protein